MSSLEIRHSARKELKILLIYPDIGAARQFEALAEQDRDLLRVDFYTVSSVAEARDSLKKHNFKLVIFEDRIDGKDFVYTQLELKNASPATEFLILVRKATVEQFEQCRKVGNVYRLEESEALKSYTELKTVLLNYVRDESHRNGNLYQIFTFTEQLQRALFLKDRTALHTKELSKSAINQLAPLYDLSQDEITTMIAAEKLYAPYLSRDDYTDLLVYDRFGLLNILRETSSWEGAQPAPGSIPGFLITLSNFVAWHAAMPSSELVNLITSRPVYLRHAGIRALNDEKLRKLVNTLSRNERLHAVV